MERDDTPLLSQDHRLKLLLPPDHEARSPERFRYFADVGEASMARDIDHSNLLDALWKLRSAETLLAEIARKTRCARTRDLMDTIGGELVSDAIEEIGRLLALKAETELFTDREYAKGEHRHEYA